MQNYTHCDKELRVLVVLDYRGGHHQRAVNHVRVLVERLSPAIIRLC